MALTGVQNTNSFDYPALEGLQALGPVGKVAALALPVVIKTGTEAVLNKIGGEVTPLATDTSETVQTKETIVQVAQVAIGLGTGTGIGVVGMGVTAIGLTACAVGVGPVAPFLLGAGAAVTVLANPAGQVAGHVGKFAIQKLMRKF